MSIVNLTSDYDSAPYTSEPDPFANWTEPGAGPTTANYTAWNTLAPYTPQAPAPPKEPTYNYQYDTWEDESGRLWDRKSGLWYSISDPNNPLVYRPQVGWQSIPQYNDYNSVLNELGQFSANPLVAQPSIFTALSAIRQLIPAEWQQIDNYKTNQRLIEAMPGLQEHDQFQYATREDNINRLMQGGYTRQEAESLPDSVAEDRARLMDRVQYARDQGQGASLSDFLGGLLGPGMQGLGLLNKYVSTPVEETLSQLTPAMLAGLKYVAPGGQQAALAADWLTGYRPEDRLLGGLKDLGSAAKDSGGNPLDFIDIQNKNFEQRPMAEQLAAQLAYDPVNLLGAGLGAKALESGALEGSGLLSSILRTGAGIDRGIETAQNALFNNPLTKAAGREIVGGGVGIGANQLAGGEDSTGLNWWQAGALGALGGNLTRGKGSLVDKAAGSLARLQGREGFTPALGLQIDDVTDPVVRELLGLDKELEANGMRPLMSESEARRLVNQPQTNVDLLSERDPNTLVYEQVKKARELLALRAEDNLSDYGEKTLADTLERIRRSDAWRSKSGEAASTFAARTANEFSLADGQSARVVPVGDGWSAQIKDVNGSYHPARSASGDIRTWPTAEAAANYLKDEGGTVAASLAARIGLTVGAGSLGYATSPEDASQREKWLRALGFAAVPAALPESTDIIAKLYGKLPFLAEEGLSRKGWMDALPEQGVLREAGVTPPIRLPEVKPGESLPTSAKISNTAWKIVGDRKNLDLAEIQPMMAAFSDAEQRIPMVADDLVKTAGDDYVRTVRLSDEGYFLGADGKPLPLLDASGDPVVVKLTKDSEDLTPVFAGARDVSDRLPIYEAKGLVTPEQVNAIKKLGEVTNEIRPAQAAFGLAPEPTPTVMDGGVYISRGTGRTAEKAPRFRTQMAEDVTRPGASKARKWTSEGEAILLGNLKYDHPIEAMQKYVREGLGQLNEANLTANLSNVKIEMALSGKPVTLGALRVDTATKDQLKDTIKTVQETKAELKKLKTRQTRVDRDVRLGSKWVEQADRRIGKLTDLASDQSLKAASRERAATDAYELAKQGFKDAESAARDYMKQTEKLAGKESQVRAQLRQTVDEARGVTRQVETRLKDATTADRIDNLNYITDTWGHADAIRQAVAADIDALSTKLEGLPLEQRQAAMAEVKDALSTARNSFNDSLTTIRQQKKAAERALVQQTKAVDNVRAMVTQGRIKELERMAEQRADSLKTSLTYSKELQDKVDELKAKLLPLEQHRDELKDVLKQSKVFRDELRKSSVPTGTIQIGEGWKDVPVPVEIANAVNKYRIDPGAQRGTLHLVGRVLDGMNTVARFMGATGDISRTAIQGVLGIGEDPSITRKGIVAGFKAVKDPEHEWTYLKNLEADRVKEGFPGIAHLVGRGNLEIAHNEYLFRGVSGDNGLLAKLAQKRPLSWFETLFSTPGNIERLERTYAYLDVAKMQGKNVMDDKVMREAAAAANMVTGRSAHNALHPLLNDRQASRVLFAGRFVQSQIDTIYNAIMVGGIEGEVARRSLSRLAIGGLALTYMINEALGEKTDWRPVADGMPNPNFARVRVAGHDVSLFGPWDSLMRGAIQTYMDNGNPSQFLRSKLAPVPGAAWDLSVGGQKTFMGDKIGFNKATVDQYLPTPFGLTDAYKEWAGVAQGKESPLDALAGTAFNVLGMKNSPLSPREKYNEKLSDAYPDWKPPVAYQKPDDPFTDPLFIRDYAAKHPDDVPSPASRLGKQMQEIRDKYEPDLAANAKKFEEDKKTLGQWKDDRHDLKLQLRTALTPIQEQMRAAFGDKQAEPGTPAAWVDSYMDTFNKATVDGVLDKKLLDKYQAEWFAENGAAGQDYIDQYFLAGADSTAERQYLTAMQRLNKDGYFDGGIPRYTGMVSGMTDDQIAEARALIAGKQEAYPFLDGAEYSLKALTVLRPLGYSMQQILDVGNSGKKAYENPKWTIYKIKHPDLMEWLDDGNFYSTIQTVSARSNSGR